jgi:hypothetical protein
VRQVLGLQKVPLLSEMLSEMLAGLRTMPPKKAPHTPPLMPLA